MIRRFLTSLARGRPDAGAADEHRYWIRLHRSAIADGRRYGHVLDPRTGWPAQGVVSVTVVASDAAAADALSTAFFVGGAELARRYCAKHRDVLAIITPVPGYSGMVA